MRLRDKVCIVTGAASGIGRGIAEVFAEQGASVIAVDRDKAGNESVADGLCSRGGRSCAITCDVSDEQQVRAMAKQAVDRYSRIDVLVNNAGVNFVKPFHQMSVGEWDHVIGVDLRGTFLCTHACIDTFLLQRYGSVVNIASVHTHACLAGAAPYDAAKWGVVGMTKALAVEYAGRGLRFNCLSPGLIDTQIWQDILNGAEDLDACQAHWRANIPAGRVGTVREIAQIAAFLASDEAMYINGCNLMADGALTSQLITRPQYASKALEGQ
jgi:NAD(P)-dependent dehydrogenase (short-subunit alcohol dehydrogenase family)